MKVQNPVIYIHDLMWEISREYITTDFNIKEDVRLDDILILTPIESH